MRSYFRNLYRKYIGNSLVYKSMLINTAISIIPIMLLVFIITNNVTNILLKKEINQSGLIAYNINNYFDQKYELVYKIIKQSYSDINNVPDVFSYIENNLDSTDVDFPEIKKKFMNYFFSFFSTDNDLKNVIIYKKVDNTAFLITQDSHRDLDENEINFNEFKNHLDQGTATTIRVFSAHYPEYNKKELVYSLSINMKVLRTFENSGVLMLDFTPTGIEKAISQMNNNKFFGSLYILTQSGDVIYDSSNKYYGKKYPFVNLLIKSMPYQKINGEECVVSVDDNNRAGLIIACVTPKNKIVHDINSINRTIIFVSILCIIIMILFTQMSSSYVSKRIKLIRNAMKSVRAGNLSTRIEIDASYDEISSIASSFNNMCDNLESSISKVYIAEIKQRSAELTALQAQINPHFLYNTLEAIRMKAISANEEEIGEMIYILANLFRSTIKDDTIVLMQDEIEYCKSYLELFKIRYGNKLSVEFIIEAQVLDIGIIKHIMQPVIENYIIHGFDLRRNNNLIKITILNKENDIYIQIEDNGVGISQEELDELKRDFETFDILNRSSIGLRNVNERIKLIYGQKYGVTIESQIATGTVVSLSVSKKTKEELIKIVQGYNCR